MAAANFDATRGRDARAARAHLGCDADTAGSNAHADAGRQPRARGRAGRNERRASHRRGTAEAAGFSHAKPVWDIPAGGQGASAGNRSGAGSAGNGISGNGAAGGGEPCGFVEFSDPHGSRFDSRTHGFWVDIRLSVHFPDGRAESLLLDYPWYYASEASNPWSDQNLNDPNFPTTFQSPPPDKLANEPPLVRYVIAHTGPGGYTLLKDCPAPKPSA